MAASLHLVSPVDLLAILPAATAHPLLACLLACLQEAAMMASLRHPSIVMYLGVCLDPPAVVTEYCARGGRGGAAGAPQRPGWQPAGQCGRMQRSSVNGKLLISPVAARPVPFVLAWCIKPVHSGELWHCVQREALALLLKCCRVAQ